MSWYADLAPCDYFGDEHAGSIRSVGWLERGHAFRRDAIDEAIFNRLQELLSNPWSPFVTVGVHVCDLCQFFPEAHGSSNLFVPGSGFLWVCPELICHYMNAHGYAPPSEFCRAVLNCPDLHTTEYRKAFLENGGRAMIVR